MNDKHEFFPLINTLRQWRNVLLALVLLSVSQACQAHQGQRQQPLQITFTSTPASTGTPEYLSNLPTQTPVPPISPTNAHPPTMRPSPTANFNWQGYIALIAGSDSTQQHMPYLYRVGDPDLVLLQSDSFLYPPDMAWSPDGKSLVFSSFVADLGWELYLFSPDTSNLHKLDTGLEGLVSFSDPAWSPNGQYLAFTQNIIVDNRLTTHIFVMQMNTGEVHFVTEGSSPAWLPDNETLIFRRTHLDEQLPLGDIFRIKMDGNDLVQLTENIYANPPIVSPDGNFIVFTAYNSPDWSRNRLDLYRMNPDGSELITLSQVDYEFISWSPDGRFLLASVDCKIYIIEWAQNSQRVGREYLNLPGDYCYYYALWQPTRTP